MEDILMIRLMFVAALLVMVGVIAAFGHAIAHLGGRFHARDRRPGTVPRQTRQSIPARGTR